MMFFYAFAILSEKDVKYQEFISKRRKREWTLRVLSNVLLLLVPVSLNSGPVQCLTALVGFYVSLLVWDAVVFVCRTDVSGSNIKNPIKFDLIGSGAAVVLWIGIASFYLKSHSELPIPLPLNFLGKLDIILVAFLIGGSTAAYLYVFYSAMTNIPKDILEKARNIH
jgi:hypothetical protein